MIIEEYTGQDISKGNVILDFYSDSCQPCKIVSSILDNYETDFGNIYKVNTSSEHGSKLASMYGIMSTPVFIFIKDNEPVDSIIGLAEIQKWLEANRKVV